ncbi:hypothetical protein EPIRMAN_GEN20615_07660 [Ralstonia mannitolilytica]|jgi:hypothetical protein
MSRGWKTFVDAAKETPRLYFAPLVAVVSSMSDVQAQMLRSYGKKSRAKTVDTAFKINGPTKRKVRG